MTRFCLLLTLAAVASVVPVQAQNFAILHEFRDSEGAGPAVAFRSAEDGQFYGTLFSGPGSNGVGAVFGFSANGTLQVLRNFDLIWGGGPTALIRGADGGLYGATKGNVGPGVTTSGLIYRMSPDGTTYSNVVDFTDISVGHRPENLLQADDGRLFGTTRFGGLHGKGTLFSVGTNGPSWAPEGLTNLLVFDGVNTGAYPGALFCGMDGKLYGATAGGDGPVTGDWGTLFRLDKEGSAYSVLAKFDPAISGAYPTALIQGTDGFLYGATAGLGDGGTIFRVSTNGGGWTNLVKFGGAKGFWPSSLLQGPDGNLYGTTRGSKATGILPAIFRVGVDGSGFTNFWQFPAPLESPVSVVFGADAKLYGAVYAGGSFGNGLVFRVDPPAAFAPSVPAPTPDAIPSEPNIPSATPAPSPTAMPTLSPEATPKPDVSPTASPTATPRPEATPQPAPLAPAPKPPPSISPRPAPDRTRPSVKITSPATVRGSAYILAARLTDNVRPVRVRYRLWAPGAKVFGKWVSVNLRSKASTQNWSQPRLALNKRGVWMIQMQVFDAANNSSAAAAAKVVRTK